MKLRNIYILAIAGILFMHSNSSALVFERKEGVEFKLINKVDLIVNGNPAEGKVFYSGNSSKEIADFYKNVFFKAGYKIENHNESGKNILLSFKKNNITHSVKVTQEKKGNTIITYKVVNKTENSNSIEKPGVDIKEIPRPINSLRELCVERISGAEKSITILYKTKESKYSVERYYREKMKKYILEYSRESRENDEICMLFSMKSGFCFINIGNDFANILYYYM